MTDQATKEPASEKAAPRGPSLGSMAAETALALSAGGVFGYALDKAKTNVPWVVSEQMALGNQTMMRMFLAASGTSVAAVLGLHALGLKQRKPKPGLSLGPAALGPCGANLVGGALLGAGMELSGSCPGARCLPAGRHRTARPQLHRDSLPRPLAQYICCRESIRICGPASAPSLLPQPPLAPG